MSNHVHIVKWHVEDAIVAYLSGIMEFPTKVYAGQSTESLQMPCVTVCITSTAQINESVPYSGHRAMSGTLRIYTQADVDGSADGRTARTVHAELYAEVMDALAIVGGLPAELNNVIDTRASISMCEIEATRHEVSNEDQAIISEIDLDMIAQPVGA